MDLIKSSLPASTLKTGSGTVGTSPIVATGVGLVGLCRGITIKADVDNAGILYVGAFVLKAGESYKFEIDDSSALMISASEAAQEYSWLAQ